MEQFGLRGHVRSELFEYLSVVANTARDGDRKYADRVRLEQRLEQIFGAALGRNPYNAAIVLKYMEPINQRYGFMAKVDLEAVPESDKRLVQTVLNAGMTVNAVQRHDRGAAMKLSIFARFPGRPLETTYLIRSDLFTLLLHCGASQYDLETRGIGIETKRGLESALANMSSDPGRDLGLGAPSRE